MFWQAVLVACNWVALFIWGGTLVLSVAVAVRGRFIAEVGSYDVTPLLFLLAVIAFFGLLNGVT